MSEDIYPFPFDRGHFLNDRTTQEASSESIWDVIREAQTGYAKLVQEAKEYELPHKHMCRIMACGTYALRWCAVPGCMQSWRLPLTGNEYGDEPRAVWEAIAEPGIDDEE